MAGKHFVHWENRSDLSAEDRDRLLDRESNLRKFLRRLESRGFKVEEEYRGLAFGFCAERKKTWFEARFLDHHVKNDWGVVNWMIKKSKNIKHYDNTFDTLEELEREVIKYVEKFDVWKAKKH